MNRLDEWTTAACGVLDLDGLTETERRTVLDLARDVAHGVVRPAAPLTAFLLGVAVGRGADLARSAAAVTELALAWAAETGNDEASRPEGGNREATRPEAHDRRGGEDRG
jgi:hypothetical protein